MWNVLDNLNDSVHFVDFNDVNEFLLEEFRQSDINVFSKLWILLEPFLHVAGQQVDEVLGSTVLDWDFNGLFGVSLNLDDTADVDGIDSLALEDVKDS